MDRRFLSYYGILEYQSTGHSFLFTTNESNNFKRTNYSII